MFANFGLFGKEQLVPISHYSVWYFYTSVPAVLVHTDLFPFRNQSLQSSIEGGTKWLVNKLKGLSSLCITFHHACTSIPHLILVCSKFAV